MNDFKTNFLVTIVFDKDSDIKKQTNIEYSLKNKIIKELQHLIKDNEIKHFIVADDEVINNKLKEVPKTGHWIDKTTQSACGVIFYNVECSECGESLGLSHTLANYCPNCGAKMEVEE